MEGAMERETDLPTGKHHGPRALRPAMLLPEQVKQTAFLDERKDAGPE
jgi:hypothetical protein